MNGHKGETLNRGPGPEPEIISDGPAEPYRVSDRAAEVALAELERRLAATKKELANIELELNEIRKRQERE